MNAKARFFDAPDAAILRISTRYDDHRAVLIVDRAGLQCDASFFSASRRLYIRSNRVLRLNRYHSQRMRLY